VSPFFRAGLAAVLVTLLIDQAHKLIMLFGLGWQEGERVALLPVLDHILVWNRGISYGLFQQDTVTGTWLLIGFKLLVTVGLAAWMWRAETKLAAIAIGCIIGGAIGNTIDRAAYGAVADFFHFHVGDFSWYVFNLADCFIVLGVALLLYDAFAPKKATKAG
jgi:signal peptidase II